MSSKESSKSRLEAALTRREQAQERLSRLEGETRRAEDAYREKQVQSLRSKAVIEQLDQKKAEKTLSAEQVGEYKVAQRQLQAADNDLPKLDRMIAELGPKLRSARAELKAAEAEVQRSKRRYNKHVDEPTHHARRGLMLSSAVSRWLLGGALLTILGFFGTIWRDLGVLDEKISSTDTSVSKQVEIAVQGMQSTTDQIDKRISELNASSGKRLESIEGSIKSFKSDTKESIAGVKEAIEDRIAAASTKSTAEIQLAIAKSGGQTETRLKRLEDHARKMSKATTDILVTLKRIEGQRGNALSKNASRQRGEGALRAAVATFRTQ